MIPGNRNGLGRRKRTFAVVGGLLALFLLAHFIAYLSQPRFQGKTLGYWLARLENPKTLPAAELAIRHIGTNAIPYYDRFVAAQDSSWKLALARALSDYPHLRALLPMAENDQKKGYAGFLTLGTVAVPHLLSKLDSADDDEALRAGEILKMMDESNGPLLRPWIDHTLQHDTHLRREIAIDLLVRFMPKNREYLPVLTNEVLRGGGDSATRAARAINILAPDAREAIPALIKSLERQESEVIHFSILALGKMGPEAKDAVPKLREIKTSYHYFLSIAASEALNRISPAQSENSN